MSHKAKIEVLAWHQPMDARSGTFLNADVAHDLVQRLAAEKISQRKIRMVSPDSIYMLGRAICPEVQRILKSLPLPPAELPGLHLQIPKNCEGVTMSSVRAAWNWQPSDYRQLLPAAG